MKLLIIVTALSLLALGTFAQNKTCNSSNDVNATNICTDYKCNKHESCETKSCWREKPTVEGFCREKQNDTNLCYENANCKIGNCDKSTPVNGSPGFGLCSAKKGGSALTIIIIIVIIAGLGVGGYIFWKKRQEKLGNQLGREPMMH